MRRVTRASTSFNTESEGGRAGGKHMFDRCCPPPSPVRLRPPPPLRGVETFDGKVSVFRDGPPPPTRTDVLRSRVLVRLLA